MDNNEDDRELCFTSVILEKKWLSEFTFEVILEKPSGITYQPGQKIMCGTGCEKREYSLASAPTDANLHLCIRQIEQGAMSTRLAEMNVGEKILLSNAYGFLIYRPGNSVFIATGTGIAPFVSYCRAGIAGFILLHGVANVSDLYYSEIIKAAASQYIPCLTAETKENISQCGGYSGRVTSYLEECLESSNYDFYLCGNGQMIRDAMLIIDKKYPESRIFTETFF